MNRDSSYTGPAASPGFLALSGVAGLFCAAVGLAIGVLEAGAPPFNSPLPDVFAYLRDGSEMLYVSTLLRFVLLPLLPVMAVGIYHWLGPSAGAWRLVGLLGLALIPSIGFPANSAATIALWRLPVLEEQSQLLTMLWSMSAVWFFGAVLLWGVGVGSFSVAGWQSARMPRWLAGLGILVGALGVVGGVGVSLFLSRELLAGAILSTISLLLPVWLVTISVILIRDSRRARMVMDESSAVD